MYDDSIWSQPPQRIKRTLSQKLSIMNHDVFVSSLSKLSQSKSWHMSQRTVHPSHSQCFDHRCQSWHYVVESAETLPGTIGTPQSQQRCEYAPLSYQDLRLRFEMVFLVWINKIDKGWLDETLLAMSWLPTSGVTVCGAQTLPRNFIFQKDQEYSRIKIH